MSETVSTASLPELKPGDLLLFSRKGIFDDAIRLKTWSQATHCEIFFGTRLTVPTTVASRNGQGVNFYKLDASGLWRVYRPQLPFDLERARQRFEKDELGRPYGWISLLSFCLIDLNDSGRFCSELATNFYRDGGLEPFNDLIASDIVAPADFTYIHESIMRLIWQA